MIWTQERESTVRYPFLCFCFCNNIVHASDRLSSLRPSSLTHPLQRFIVCCALGQDLISKIWTKKIVQLQNQCHILTDFLKKNGHILTSRIQTQRKSELSTVPDMNILKEFFPFITKLLQLLSKLNPQPSSSGDAVDPDLAAGDDGVDPVHVQDWADLMIGFVCQLPLRWLHYPLKSRNSFLQPSTGFL